MNKIRCLFGQEDYCEVRETDDDFERRMEQMRQEQQEVETRLRALGTTVDVHVFRDKYGKVQVDVDKSEGRNEYHDI